MLWRMDSSYGLYTFFMSCKSLKDDKSCFLTLKNADSRTIGPYLTDRWFSFRLLIYKADIQCACWAINETFGLNKIDVQ